MRERDVILRYDETGVFSVRSLISVKLFSDQFTGSWIVGLTSRVPDGLRRDRTMRFCGRLFAPSFPVHTRVDNVHAATMSNEMIFGQGKGVVGWSGQTTGQPTKYEDFDLKINCSSAGGLLSQPLNEFLYQLL